MANRLANATSPYLLQHAENPVDWWEWGPGAFAEAKRRDTPILLSVGYAACHWCHVMAHESFSDPAVAALINEHFVPIKVDREERPDIDAVYMTATQALTGQGGWPMTCFLTPAGEPFYAGTYFPPRATGGLPGFTDLLHAIVRVWRVERSETLAAAGRITAALQQVSAPLRGSAGLGEVELAAAATTLIRQFDPVYGGFAGAPKFPPTMVAEFLLRQHEATGDPEALEAVTTTLDRMARGGIFDQLAGGFARYSVDGHWRVPHFEKMLDDNAALLRLYAHHARLTGAAQSEAVARATAGFLLAEMRLPTGAFAIALDADTAGEEGGTYLWTAAQLRQVLGEPDGRDAADWFGLPDHDGGLLDHRVLTLESDPPEPQRFSAIRRRLLEARAARPQPLRDDLVALRSNGSTIAALAEAGALWGEPGWIAAAADAADHLWSVHHTSGGWRGASRDGQPTGAPAGLADLALFAGGLLALFQATGAADRLAGALELIDRALLDFAADDGGFFDAAADPRLPMRPRDPTDTAAPSGSAALADAALTASALTGRADLRSVAEQILASAGELVVRAPRATGMYLCVARAAVSGPVQVAVTGPHAAELAATARRGMPGGAVIDVGEPDAPGHPLLAGRSPIDARATAYVCRGFHCDLPTTDPAALLAQLS